MDNGVKQSDVTSQDDHCNVQEKPKSYVKDRVTLTVVVMLYMCANTSVLPVYTQYIHSRYEDVYSNDANSSTTPPSKPPHLAYANEDADEVQVRVQQSTSYAIIKLSLCALIPPAFVNMVMGSYSDHIGRKVLFILPLLGCSCKYLVFISVVKFHLHLNFLILGVLLDGFSGSSSTFVLANMAYAADVTKTHATRTLAIVIADSSVSVAIALGQLMTGLLIENLGYFYPPIINTGLILLAIAIVTFGLTETVRESKVKNLSPVVHIKKVFGFYVNKSQDNKRCIFIASLVVFALINIGLSGRNTIETLYQLGRPFSWNPVQIGYFGAYAIVFQTLCGLVAIKMGSTCVRIEVLAVTGIFLLMGSLILEGLATTDVMLFAVPCVASISAVTMPVIRSVMSHMVDAHKQGAIFSSMATVETLCGAVGSSSFTFLYSATVDTMRGMAFLLIAVVIFMAALTMIVVIVKSPRQPDRDLLHSPPEDQDAPGLGCTQSTKLLGGGPEKIYLSMEKCSAVV
ncbi:solute carrier family 46 member 3-like [Haliotis rufescens]|uniref:solute carrier family 46 member 3-like n=1 Tax=Haliotis rufescens TaxID=6454 RepID=UPI001EAFC9D5|nr:solute carrier family 46 member 3-like [Haliotis rufescens]XP_046342972.1 solute carrier family 46 member 3-like [Haliotis rufescens]